MTSQKTYLQMQKDYYDADASKWSLRNKNPVVGGYYVHEEFPDYDFRLFRFDTAGKIALEYGCGPGRNLIRYNKRFRRIDGVDISNVNLANAILNLEESNIPIPALYHNDGSTMPMIPDNMYDVVFATICLQHICSYAIRYSILSESYRVMKSGGYLCFQMGFGNDSLVGYYDDYFEATTTNGHCDVGFSNEDFIKDDLQKIGFINYSSEFSDPCQDKHPQWIWIQVQKP